VTTHGAPASRYEFLDGARGLAALAVVIFHRGTLPGFGHPLDWVARYGEVGAYIFFVISGYVIYQSAERHFATGSAGWLSFLVKRARRIYPAFWASLILALAVAWLLLRQSFGVPDVLGTATLTDGILDLHSPQVIYWTLAYEQQFYIAMAILILPIFGSTRPWLIIISSSIAVAHTLGVLSNHWINSTLPNHWLEFELGILVYLILQRRITRWATIPAFVALLIVAFNANYRLQAAALFAILIMMTARFDGRMTKSLAFWPIRALGLISYSLYLVHLPAFALNDRLLARVLPAGTLLWYASGIAAAFLLAAVFYAFCERPFLPARRNSVPARGPVVLADAAQ
jgi:peptidoglycan/LPS O-acetylase OafA/YrhL